MFLFQTLKDVILFSGLHYFGKKSVETLIFFSCMLYACSLAAFKIFSFGLSQFDYCKSQCVFLCLSFLGVTDLLQAMSQYLTSKCGKYPAAISSNTFSASIFLFSSGDFNFKCIRLLDMVSWLRCFIVFSLFVFLCFISDTLYCFIYKFTNLYICRGLICLPQFSGFKKCQILYLSALEFAFAFFLKLLYFIFWSSFRFPEEKCRKYRQFRYPLLSLSCVQFPLFKILHQYDKVVKTDESIVTHYY